MSSTPSCSGPSVRPSVRPVESRESAVVSKIRVYYWLNERDP